MYNYVYGLFILLDGDDGPLSVPASWQEQGQAYHPSVYYYTEPSPDIKVTSIESRAPAADYCEMFEKISETPSLYTCKICGKTVSNRWHHSSIHRPQSNKCPLCQQSFTRKDNMKAHIRLKHGRPLEFFETLNEVKSPPKSFFNWKME